MLFEFLFLMEINRRKKVNFETSNEMITDHHHIYILTTNQLMWRNLQPLAVL